MKLAKNHVDAGYFSTRPARALAFWQGPVGLPFEELLPLGGGSRQHRHALNGSVLKLNESRDPPLAAPPSGYVELLVARDDVERPVHLTEPDGGRVTLVPPGHDGIVGIGVRIAASDVEAHRAFYGHALGLTEEANGRFRCGDTLLMVDPGGPIPDLDMRHPGFRYLTVQVFDVDAEHAGILARGGREGRAPATLGQVARISFVRDPDGNWIEISQRRSLTGTLAASGGAS